jgi:hypothetical protein
VVSSEIVSHDERWEGGYATASWWSGMLVPPAGNAQTRSRQLLAGARIRSAEGRAVGRPGILGSLKQALSFGCGLLRLRC